MSYFGFLRRFKSAQFKGRSLRKISLFIGCFLSIVLVSWVVMAQSAPVVLRVLVPAPDAPPLTGIVQAFERQNPHIRIELVEGPNATNLVEDLYTSAFLLGDSPYDLINMDIVWTPKFAAAGWLMDLSDRVKPDELARFSPVDVEGGRYEGRLYRLPMRSDVGLLYYRKDLLEAAGLQPPETFDDLMKISKILQEQDKVPWGYVWQGRQYEGAVAMFVEVLKGYGGFWIDPKTDAIGLDRPEAIQAINFLRSTINEGISPPGVTTYQEEDTRRFFQSGQAAFLRSWPYVWTLANAEESKLRGKVGIQPMVHAAGKESGACLGGWGLGISKTTAHPKEAWKAVQFFTSVDPLRDFVLKEGYTPSIWQFFNDPEMVSRYNHFPQMQEVVNNAVLRPPIAQYAQASDILQRYLSAALTDRMSPEEAMQRASGETRRLLGVKG
ncbi:MAG: ABC transporter substrate-binding protein [Oscillatoriales cyanobacterium C42_A2020_001]|nr:ABC transporter substrate-binding protein [Leptolyngbyaceae cyanobacterium C42_A2020_001]